MDLVSKSEDSIKITSPFLKENICNEMINFKRSNVCIELITSFKLANVRSGSLDLKGIELILNNNGIVKNYPRLHSKIYIFDNTILQTVQI